MRHARGHKLQRFRLELPFYLFPILCPGYSHCVSEIYAVRIFSILKAIYENLSSNSNYYYPNTTHYQSTQPTTHSTLPTPLYSLPTKSARLFTPEYMTTIFMQVNTSFSENMVPWLKRRWLLHACIYSIL